MTLTLTLLMLTMIVNDDNDEDDGNDDDDMMTTMTTTHDNPPVICFPTSITNTQFHNIESKKEEQVGIVIGIVPIHTHI